MLKLLYVGCSSNFVHDVQRRSILVMSSIEEEETFMTFSWQVASEVAALFITVIKIFCHFPVDMQENLPP